MLIPNKKLFCRVIFTLLFLCTYSYSHTKGANTDDLSFETRYGFLSSGTIFSIFKDARVSLSSLLEELDEEYNGHIEIKFYSNSKEAYTTFNSDDKLKMITVSSSYFFENRKNIENIASNFWTISYDDSKFVQYYLLGRKDLKFESFKDLNNKIISIPQNNKAAHTWIDKNSLLSNKKTYKKVIKKIENTENGKKALLNIFFEKSDFAVVSKDTWNKVLEQNPNIIKKIKVIKKSENLFIPLVGFFKKNEETLSLETFFSITDNKNLASKKEKIQKMLKINKIFKLTQDEINTLQEYYLEYFLLKKRYEK